MAMTSEISSVTKHNNCVFYLSKIDGQIKIDDAKDLFGKVKEVDPQIFKDQKWFVLQIPHVQTAHPSFYSVLCRISSYVEQYGLKLSIIADPKICNLIIKNGIERMVHFAVSTEEFYKIHGIDTTKESTRIFLNCLLESTITTVKILLELENIKNEVTIITDQKKIPSIQIGAMAGIISAHFSGNLVIGFTLDVFKKAMSKFLQTEITEVDDEIKDGAGEFLNVIIGQTKTKLNESGFGIRQVIPSVISGDNIEIGPMGRQPYIFIKCITDIGEIFLFLSTHPTGTPKN